MSVNFKKVQRLRRVGGRKREPRTVGAIRMAEVSWLMKHRFRARTCATPRTKQHRAAPSPCRFATGRGASHGRRSGTSNRHSVEPSRQSGEVEPPRASKRLINHD